MSKKIQATITYDYEGDETTDEDIIKTEKEFWATGAVGLSDIMEGGDGKFDLVVVETADAE